MHINRIINSELVALNESNSDGVSEEKYSHCHKAYEIYYIVQGEREAVVDGQKFFLSSDSFLLIPLCLFHQWRIPADKKHHVFNIRFMPEIMSETEKILFNDILVKPLHFLSGSKYHLNFYIQSIRECEAMEKLLQKTAIRYRLFSLLAQVKSIMTNAAKPVMIDECIHRMLVYFSEHFNETISLDEIANKFGVSKNVLNTRFNDSVGTTIMRYITIKRLEFAQQKILDGVRAGEAADMAGFREYNTFYRSYKSYFGCHPTQKVIDSQLQFTAKELIVPH